MSAEEGIVASVVDSTNETRLRLVVSDDLDDREIEAVAAEIRSIGQQAELAFTCAVGRLLVERFYGGDLAACRDHAPAKHASFRRLAELLRDDDDGMCASALCRCVAVHCLVERRGGLVACEGLTFTHLRAVLPLPESEQKRLLAAVIEHGWTTRELEAAVRAENPSPPPPRRSRPAFVRAIARIERILVEQDLALRDVSRACELSPTTTLDLYQRVLRIRERLERLQNALSPKGVEDERQGVPRRRP
jgi:hypothetical protein